ncbi:MAG: hypothetical protein KBC83_02960 [Candidatus Moranbacteria bacterium]|nr:hypothetical protein [Candidatus Moranbacteria bacterium]
MKPRFSQELRDRIKAYFQKRCALTISDDEADEYLDSLADLYQAFSEMRHRPSFADRQKGRGRSS